MASTVRAPTRLSPVSRRASISIGTSHLRGRSGKLRRDQRLDDNPASPPRSGSGICSFDACGFSTTSALRSCSPSVSRTVTMLDLEDGRIVRPAENLDDVGAEVAAQLDRIAARHDELREIDDDRDLLSGHAAFRPRWLQVERAQQVAIDQLQRRAGFAGLASVGASCPPRLLAASRPSRPRPWSRGCPCRDRSAARRRSSRTSPRRETP